MEKNLSTRFSENQFVKKDTISTHFILAHECSFPLWMSLSKTLTLTPTSFHFLLIVDQSEGKKKSKAPEIHPDWHSYPHQLATKISILDSANNDLWIINATSFILMVSWL